MTKNSRLLIVAISVFLSVIAGIAQALTLVDGHVAAGSRGTNIGLDDVDGSCLSEPRPRWF